MIVKMLTSRCLQILRHMLITKKPSSIAELGEQYGVSVRAIQYDLKKIGSWGCRHDLNILERGMQGYVGIAGGQKNRDNIIRCLEETLPNEYAYSPEERRHIILDRLFEAGGKPISLSNIAEEINVSKGAIYRDSNALCDYLHTYGLELNSDPRIGTCILGEERTIRGIYLDMILSLLDPYRRGEEGYASIDIARQWELINVPISVISDVDIAPIIKAVKSHEEYCNYILTDQSFVRLYVYLAVAAHRLEKGHEISAIKQDMGNIIHYQEYESALRIKDSLEHSYPITFTNNELTQLVCRLLGSQIYTHYDENQPTLIGSLGDEIRLLARQIINAVEERLSVSFSCDELFRDLCLQIRTHLYCKRFDLPEEKNDLISEIKSLSPDVYSAVKNTSSKVLGEDVSEEVVGFITSHIYHALFKEIEKTQQHKIRVLVVCGSSLGTSKILVSRLKVTFDNIQVLGSVPMHNLNSFLNKYACDLIISTVPLPNQEIEYVKVSPLLGAEDINKLRKHLRERVQKESEHHSVRQVTDTIANLMEMNDVERLQLEISALKKVLRDDDHNIAPIHIPNFVDLLEPDAILINAEATNWQDAIRLASEPLVERGHFTEKYVETMISNKDQIGDYIVISEGVAFPHASPKDGVLRTCFGLTTLKIPVEFGHPQNDPVDVVIVMGCTENCIHTKALYQLLQVLENEKKMRIIRNAENPIEILAVCMSP